VLFSFFLDKLECLIQLANWLILEAFVLPN
jgi:hypothetical protein